MTNKLRVHFFLYTKEGKCAIDYKGATTLTGVRRLLNEFLLEAADGFTKGHVNLGKLERFVLAENELPDIELHIRFAGHKSSISVYEDTAGADLESIFDGLVTEYIATLGPLDDNTAIPFMSPTLDKQEFITLPLIKTRIQLYKASIQTFNGDLSHQVVRDAYDELLALAKVLP